MKKLAALASVGLAAVLLTGCSEQTSALAACAQVATQTARVTGVVDAASSPTVETAQAAFDEISTIVDDIRAIEGPAEFVTLRDSWTTSIDAFLAASKSAVAGEAADVTTATTAMQNATDAVITYCTP
ncbi:hypothetical protein ACI3KS_10945 [Microbacterium sp. ZW T5_45]|uniref:hypothetical protein n=1 Tax=Microbacterium sp. ZW T5_45 TaxID=3378080 RepID=UPI003853373F